MLIGAVLKDEHKGKAKAILLTAMDEGVMVLIAGANVVRFAPSLIVPNEDINQGMDKLEIAIGKYLA